MSRSDSKAAWDCSTNTPSLPYHTVQGIKCVLIAEQLFRNEEGCKDGQNQHLLLLFCGRKREKKKKVSKSASFCKCLDYKVLLGLPEASSKSRVLASVPDPSLDATLSCIFQFYITGSFFWTHRPRLLLPHCRSSAVFRFPLSGHELAPADSVEHLARGITIIGLDLSASAIGGA